ncbi:ECF RNA polymerase sigma factor SigK [Jannaschia sp. R86511]|uniref:ECF RNA polymerase sigma factor SigK n=1 Tax=Jannaschia sp. R86511 TaxID=3093853 RepID=UPI0036D314E3
MAEPPADDRAGGSGRTGRGHPGRPGEEDGGAVQAVPRSGAGVAAPVDPRAGRVVDPEEQAQLRALVQRVAMADEAAYEELYDRLSATVYGVCRRVLRDPSESEEVAQEVLLEIWRTATRYDPDRAGVRSWAVMIAHSRAVDRVRSSQRRRAREEATALPEPPAVDEVSEAAVSAFEVRRVRRAMAELSDLQRESVRLAFYGGHTHREVSALLGVPLGTVKTRIRDGLTRLRAQLGPELDLDGLDPPPGAPAAGRAGST